MKKFNIILLLACIIFAGCCSPKEIIREVPVEVVHDVYHNVYIHDTTHTTDSVIMYQKGDTVFKEKYVYKYIGNTVHDTIATHDTIPAPYPVVEEKIIKEAKWWPVWLVLGIELLGIIAIIIIKIENKFKIKK